MPLPSCASRRLATALPLSPRPRPSSATAALLHTSPRSAFGQKTLAVLGGGISGLTTAHRLSQRLPSSQYRVVLLEKSQRLGGWIESQSTSLPSSSAAASPSNKDAHAPSSALIEKGPRSIRPTGPTGMVMLELLMSLGLLDRMLKVPKTAASAQNRYIYYPDRLAKLPSSLPSLFTALSKLSFLRSALPKAALEFRVPSRFARPRSESKKEQDRLHRREALEDESVDSFVSRRFGPGLAANLVSAVIHGIYAGDSRKLSVRSVMPFLWEAERTHGSVLKSLFLSPRRNKRYRNLPEHETASKERRAADFKEVEQRLGRELTDSFKGISVYSFPNGLQEIVDALEQQLEASPGVEVRKGTGVASVLVGKDGKLVLETSTGDKVEADRVVSALPSTQLAKSLQTVDELPGLDYNPSANVGVVNIVISPATEGEASSSRPLLPVEGFGYLIPRTTPNNEDGILGVVFDSDSLPTQDLEDPLSSAAAADATRLAQRPVKLTVMMGGTHWSHLDAASLPTEDEMRQRAIRAVSQHLSIPASLLQDAARTKIVPTMQRDCIPQYLVGHPIRMEALHSALSRHETLSDRLTLVGASYTGVSLNDCVAYAIETADRIVDAELGHRTGGRSKVVTGLENFTHSSAEPLQQSAEVIQESISEAPALSGAMQRMVRSGQMWWQQVGRSATGASSLMPARGLHTSAVRRDAKSSLSPSPLVTPASTSSTATNAAAAGAKQPRPLGEVLAESIRASGPMPVSTYMRTCLLDPIQGYYSSANAEPTSADVVSREVLGLRGDFITSPEISQVFGELVAVFYIARWQACQMPPRTRLVELGPGKGTLLVDMLRTFSVFPQFFDTVESIHLLETSEGLMKLQLDAVKGALEKAGKKLVPADQAEVSKDEIRIEWFNDIADVPLQPDVFTILTAHEFFDALPTHVFEKTVNGFREVLVGVKTEAKGQKGVTVLRPSDLQSHKTTHAEREQEKKQRQDELQFVLSPGPTLWSKLLADSNKQYASVQPGQRIEVSPESWAIGRRVGEIVSGRPASSPRPLSDSTTIDESVERERQRLTPPSQGGISLIIDYGGDQTYASSLRAFKRHEIVDVFHQPGKCDLTVNVDFLHLKTALETTEAKHKGPMEQAHFLVAMGLEQRVDRLRDAKHDDRKRQIESAANRLVDLTGMGKQYKVLAVQADASDGGYEELQVETNEPDQQEKAVKLRLKTHSAAKLYPFEM